MKYIYSRKEKYVGGVVHLKTLLFSFLALLVLGLVVYLFKSNTLALHNEIAATSQVNKAQDYSFASSSFALLPIEAKSYVVYDPHTMTVVASKDADTPYALASVTKIMTGFIAKENLSETELIRIETRDLSPSGDSGLRVGKEIGHFIW